MSKETLNILVFEDQVFRVRSLRIKKETLIILFSLLILFQLAGTLFFFDYLQVKKKFVSLNRLRQELQIQNSQIQQFSLKMKDLDEKLIKLKHLDKRIRMMVNLERAQDGVSLLGLGGFPPSGGKKKSNKEPQGDE